MSELAKLTKNLFDGDVNSFDKIYELTSKQVFMSSYIILKNEEQANDIVQDTYIKFVNNIKNMKSFKNVKAYLITISRNLSIDFYNREKRVIIYDIQDKSTHQVFQTDDKVLTYSPTLELAKKILNDFEFTILFLCVIEQYKRREVSKILDIPISTVTWKYQEIIKKMKTAISKEGNL